MINFSLLQRQLNLEIMCLTHAWMTTSSLMIGHRRTINWLVRRMDTSLFHLLLTGQNCGLNVSKVWYHCIFSEHVVNTIFPNYSCPLSNSSRPTWRGWWPVLPCTFRIIAYHQEKTLNWLPWLPERIWSHSEVRYCNRRVNFWNVFDATSSSGQILNCLGLPISSHSSKIV